MLTSPASRSHWGHTVDTMPSRGSSVRGTPGAPRSETRVANSSDLCGGERRDHKAVIPIHYQNQSWPGDLSTFNMLTSHVS